MNAQVCWINNCPTLLHLPDQINVGTAVDGSARIAGVGTGRTLVMGRNNIDRALADKYKQNPQVATWFKIRLPESGKPMIEEDGNTSLPEGVPAPENLTGYGVPAAVAMVEGESNVVVLDRWMAVETRSQVTEALRRKIASMGGGVSSSQSAQIEAEIERRAQARVSELLEQGVETPLDSAAAPATGVTQAKTKGPGR